MIPPPHSTPAPDYPPELPKETPSGVYRMKRERKRTDLKLVGVVVVALGTVFGAYRAVLGDARAQTDAGVKTLELRVGAVEQQVPQLRGEVQEARVELRELYKAVMTKKRSDKLESPPPPLGRDGGA